MNIRGSRILITGGSLGIGKATAKVLAEAGASVVITGRDGGRLKKAENDTGARGVVADVRTAEDIDRTFEFVESNLGGLDCLVNNAGIGAYKALSDFSAREFLEVFETNVVGAALMARRAAEIFKKQNRGDIINIGSTAALKGYERGSIYVASKFALRGMTMCWQAELRKYNVRVILINPSEVPTAIGSPERVERTGPPNKLSSYEIAHAIKSVLEMDDRGFIPELSVWATNPWS
jgi:3-oxoacyl-[acyl-carrier protein] reductase